jgi:hypothetical protein
MASPAPARSPHTHPYPAAPANRYQGEANTKDEASADAYACLFPSMIQSWRANFGLPLDAYFGFVQLSTWAVPGDAIPLMRQAQMAAVTLQGAGYALNADREWPTRYSAFRASRAHTVLERSHRSPPFRLQMAREVTSIHLRSRTAGRAWATAH